MRISNERTKLRRIGNGQGILLSGSICRLMGIDVGSFFRVDIEDDRLVLTPQKEV